ncbi:MAG: ferritin-like domain-containing protein [Alphaproteobacteria bacterium]
MKRWSEQDIPWRKFDPSKVDPDVLKIVKAASMVEKNAGDYAHYLCNVFHDDPEFQAVARGWAEEEVQHGDVLARWAELADSGFDFQDRFKRFTEGYRLPLDATQSVRGSRAGELVARCIVEVGTNSYYSALTVATDEPVLKAICKRIADDEMRHYKLFYTHLERYLDREGLGVWGRLRIALGRLGESEDDELGYAYYAANGNGEPYDRRRNIAAYGHRAFRHYHPAVIKRGVALILKAVGLKTNGRIGRIGVHLVSLVLRLRRHQFAKAELL